MVLVAAVIVGFGFWLPGAVLSISCNKSVQYPRRRHDMNVLSPTLQPDPGRS